MVHARLDDQTEQVLSRLRRTTGLGESDLIRQGLRVLGSVSARNRKQRIVGVGAFASGIRDLASNKRHLDGFGHS